MLRDIKLLINGFLSRDGASVFIAMAFSRLISFISQWIALQMINERSLGLVLYSYSYLVFLIPIGGWGLNQSFLRFAAINSDLRYKEDLFQFTLRRGFILSLTFSLVIFLAGFLLVRDNQELRMYFMIFSFSLISFFYLDLFKNYFRVQHKNKLFAKLEITYSLTLLLSVIVLSYFFKSNGYALALTFSPLFSAIVFLPFVKFRTKAYKKPANINFNFWKYGFFAELAGVSHYLLYSIDLILIQNIMKQSEAVTHYKYVSIIPYSFLFLPSILITTDFVKLTENIDKKNIISSYINNYWKLFSLVSLGVIILAFVFPKLILSIFLKGLEQHVLTFQILMIGVIGTLMWRGLFGNLLSSIGKMHINFWLSSGGLILNLALNFLFIPRYGINGAAMTSAIIMWISGYLSYIIFKKYQREIISGKK